MPSQLHHCLKDLMTMMNLRYCLLLLELFANFEQQIEYFEFALFDYLKLQVVELLLEVDYQLGCYFLVIFTPYTKQCC